VIRELLPQQQPRTIERRDLQYITISKEELTSSDSLSPDPWKRDAREKAEKQQQLHIVDMLDKEIQELQVKGLLLEGSAMIKRRPVPRSPVLNLLFPRRSRSEQQKKATASGS